MRCCMLGALLLALAMATPAGSAEVQLPDGSVLVGAETRTWRQKRPVYEFRGLRYGSAPGGEHRFKPSKPAGPIGQYDATWFAPPCPVAFNWSNDWFTEPDQEVVRSVRRHTEGEDPEDCLFLNVFTPTLDADARLAVLVHVHGGSFIAGTALLARPGFMLEHDILLVTVQYRLGVHGFLYLGTPDAPGNVGLGDMLEALRWVQRNIAAFGGDPDRVTVSGGSAGAAAAEFLALSPQSAGLMHRALAMSGSSFAPWATVTPDKAEAMAREIGDDVGCAHEISADRLVACLRETSLDNLTEAFLFNAVAWWGSGEDAMPGATPVLQPDHLPEEVRVLPFSPTEACRSMPVARQYNHTAKALMAGVTKHDGHFFIRTGRMMWSRPMKSELERRITAAEYTMTSLGLKEYNPVIADALYQKYFASRDGKPIDPEVAFTDFVGVSKFKGPLMKSASCNALNGAPTFVYTLNHRGSFRNEAIEHGIDVLYLSPRSDFNLSEEDELVSTRLVHLHANFIMYGDPTPNVSLVEDVPVWPKFSPFQTGRYMRIDWPFQVLSGFESNEFDITLREQGFGSATSLSLLTAGTLATVLLLVALLR